MNEIENDKIRRNVRDIYSKIPTLQVAGCCSDSIDCCSTGSIKVDSEMSLKMGYSESDLTSVPENSNFGLGCGNPKAIASLKSGEFVLDLGSGGGFDAFLSASEVGPNGKVIGVDMTPEMVSLARNNAQKGNYTNTDFRLGEIENLPVADNSIDVIISNCVINLSPNKQRVFDESFRVLKSGGRLAISDVVASAEIPEEVKTNLSYYSACISGASAISDLTDMLKKSGFENIRIEPKEESKIFMNEWTFGANITDFVISATIEATKP